MLKPLKCIACGKTVRKNSVWPATYWCPSCGSMRNEHGFTEVPVERHRLAFLEDAFKFKAKKDA